MKINVEITTHQMLQLMKSQSLSNSVQEQQSSEHDGPPAKKPKQVDQKTRAPRKRRLRPEDERTLQILSEKFRSDQNGMVCQVANCNAKPIQCSKPSNLKRHLSNVHPKVYVKLFPNEVSKKKQIELEAFNLAQDTIELVTVNGYPFNMLNASGMQGFIKPRLQTIRSEGYVLSINRKNIAAQVAEQSSLVKNYIAHELKGKTVSIMFDVCTISTLSMLGRS